MSPLRASHDSEINCLLARPFADRFYGPCELTDPRPSALDGDGGG
jgi:hypothetical protein